jgi:hypothetical protein
MLNKTERNKEWTVFAQEAENLGLRSLNFFAYIPDLYQNIWAHYPNNCSFGRETNDKTGRC